MSALFLLCAAVCSEPSWLGLPAPRVPEKGKMDRIPHLRSFWDIRAGLGVCLWIGLLRDFTIVPEDYGRSFPDSRPDAFLAHQKAADSISARFHGPDRFTAKNPLRIISRGDFQEFVSASCSWRQCRPIPQR